MPLLGAPSSTSAASVWHCRHRATRQVGMVVALESGHMPPVSNTWQVDLIAYHTCWCLTGSKSVFLQAAMGNGNST